MAGQESKEFQEKDCILFVIDARPLMLEPAGNAEPPLVQVSLWQTPYQLCACASECCLCAFTCCLQALTCVSNCMKDRILGGDQASSPGL